MITEGVFKVHLIHGIIIKQLNELYNYEIIKQKQLEALGSNSEGDKCICLFVCWHINTVK